MKIFKYEVQPGGEHQMVGMHKDAILLDMQSQGGMLVLWAAVDPQQPIVQRDLSVIGTGWDLPCGTATYMATAQQGSLVWHLIDGGEV